MQSTFFFQGESTKPLFFAAAARELAYEIHEGQKRKDGRPYITHPVAVEKIAVKMAEAQNMSRLEKEVISAISFLHDGKEDCGLTDATIRERLAASGADEIELRAVIEGVDMLTRTSRDIGIIEYLNPIKKHLYPKIVKLADLRHNLSDLGPGNLYDKYVLCQHFLLH